MQNNFLGNSRLQEICSKQSISIEQYYYKCCTDFEYFLFLLSENNFIFRLKESLVYYQDLILNFEIHPFPPYRLPNNQVDKFDYIFLYDIHCSIIAFTEDFTFINSIESNNSNGANAVNISNYILFFQKAFLKDKILSYPFPILTKEYFKFIFSNELSTKIEVANKEIGSINTKYLNGNLSYDKIFNEYEKIIFDFWEYVLKSMIDKIKSKRLYISSLKEGGKKNSNKSSMEKFISQIFREYEHSANPKICVIRLDLYYDTTKYKVNCFDKLSRERNLDDIKLDFQNFLNYIREKFSKKISEKTSEKFWYIWKLEFGIDRGYHYHCIIFLDGQKHQQDINLAIEMGEQWKRVITNNRGNYFNCNAHKEKYSHIGIGNMTKYDEKYKNLKNYVLPYLIKGKDFLLRDKDRKVDLVTEEMKNCRKIEHSGKPKHSTRGRKAKSKKG